MNSETFALSRLESILRGFSGRSLLVVGDLILDEFIWGRVDRISPEAPVPVVEVVRESELLGGAANVARNLVSLGASVRLVGAVGDDGLGDRFLRLTTDSGVGTSGVVVDAGRRTTCKSRIIAHHQQVCRFDREDRVPLSESARKRIRENGLAALEAVDGVIVSDYSKGVVEAELVHLLEDGCRKKGLLLAVDPKVQDFSVYRGASIVTPNKRETEVASGVRIVDEATAEAAARVLQRQTEARAVLITRGEEGMSLLEAHSFRSFPAVAREVFDVTGAGDTVIAALALAVAAGASIAEAAFLANYSAGIVVGKLGTATVSVNELLAAVVMAES